MITQAYTRDVGRTVVAEVPWWVWELLEQDDDQRRFWITKGLGAGGTYGGVIWHYLMCEINAAAPLSWVIAPTYTQVADALIPTFGEVLQGVFQLSEGQDYSIVASGRPRILLHKTGQEIHLKTANRPETLVAANVSHITGTEPGLWSELAYSKASGRLRHPLARRRQFLLEGTPEGMGNFYQRFADFPAGENPQSNSYRIILHTDDNKILPESYVPNLRRIYEHDQAKVESYIFGRFASFQKGTAYWEFRESRNVVLDVKPDKNLPLIFAWDFNTTPISWVVLQRQPHEKRGYRYHRFVALAESTGKARGIMDGCAEFIAQFDQLIYRDTPIEIDGGHDGYFHSALSNNCAYDQIQRYLAPYYRNVTVTAARAAPTIQSRLERVNALFAHEMYVVAAWCRNLIRSHSQSSLKEGKWELEKKPGVDPTHFADAPGYPLFNRTKDLNLDKPNARKIYGTNTL